MPFDLRSQFQSEGYLKFLWSWPSNMANTYYVSHLLQLPEAADHLRGFFVEQNQSLKFTSQIISQSIF